MEVQARELQSKYEKQMKILRDDLELRRKQELHETEERKNAHIRELMRKHRQVMSQARSCPELPWIGSIEVVKSQGTCSLTDCNSPDLVKRFLSGCAQTVGIQRVCAQSVGVQRD